MLLTRKPSYEVRAMRRARAALVRAGLPLSEAEAEAIARIDFARAIIRDGWNRLTHDYPPGSSRTMFHKLMRRTYRRAFRVVFAG